ncbi:DUF1707 domain-containing protein [Streptomyces fagopyri]|uniref:DUF1707 SHOCT-like domain-containing protein n=1 Tax=Streptomyces fagopyri TaxID=2662397 RepID=UPI0036B4611E
MKSGEERTPGTPILASNAERDRVEALLKHSYVVGRLTLPELEERVAVAFEARTREQLEALLADLPDDAAVRGRPAEVIDSRLLIMLLCCSPPAALIYWLMSQRAARRRDSQPQSLDSGHET